MFRIGEEISLSIYNDDTRIILWVDNAHEDPETPIENEYVLMLWDCYNNNTDYVYVKTTPDSEVDYVNGCVTQVMVLKDYWFADMSDINNYEPATVSLVGTDEEFFDRYYRPGTKIITDGWSAIHDGEVLEITGYAVADGNVVYVVKHQYGRTADLYVKPGHIARVLSEEEAANYVPQRRRICDRCGASYIVDENLYASEYMCPACGKYEYVTQYHRNQPPLKFFSLTNRRNDSLFYGVELEVEYGGESDREAAKVVNEMRKDGVPFVYASHDGSLNNGIEFITMPATIGYHKSIESEYEKIFKMLVKDGYRGHNSENAGIHVHFSRDYFEGNELYLSNLLLLVDRFWDEIIVFSRRDYNRCKQYMKKVSSDYSTNKYYIDEYNSSDSHSGHYYAVNITNEDTIELRFFKSTLNVNTFMCILDFVDKLVRTAKTKTPSQIMNMKFESLLTKRALEYYNSRLEQRRFSEIET